MLATTRLVRAWKRTSSCTMAECAGLPAGVADEFDPSRVGRREGVLAPRRQPGVIGHGDVQVVQ